MEHSCFPGPYPSSCATLVCVPTNQPPHARGRTGSHGAHNCESTEHRLHPATLQSDTTSDHQHHETPAIFFVQKGKHKNEAQGPRKNPRTLTASLLVEGENHPTTNHPKKMPPKNEITILRFPKPPNPQVADHQTTEDATGLSILRSTHGKVSQLLCHQVAGGGREVRYHLLHLGWPGRWLLGRPLPTSQWWWFPKIRIYKITKITHLKRA